MNRNHLYPLDGRLFKGGAPSAPPTPPPPIRQSNLDVRSKNRNAQRARLRNSSFRRSLIGGETGGFQPAGTKSLLGE